MRKVILSLVLIAILFLPSVYASKGEEDFAYKSKGKRDPFMPLVTKEGRILPGARGETDTGDIHLEGIIWDENGKSLAIINGKLVKELDVVYGMEILVIKKKSVILQKEGKTIVVEVNKKGEGQNEDE
ncbi:MAG: hypothetical protein GY853_04980 [PVC group bacterium]|nr:hypothetical protein [PVC group bacterium]